MVIPSEPTRDHPRMCGEHGGVDAGDCAEQGSSPHVRGALAQVVREFVRIGIIPACAGSTDATSDTNLPTRDHPRMCGEHVREMP